MNKNISVQTTLNGYNCGDYTHRNIHEPMWALRHSGEYDWAKERTILLQEIANLRRQVTRLENELIDTINSEGINIDTNVEFEKEGEKFKFKVGGKIYNIEYTQSITPSNNESVFEFKFKLLNNPKQPKRNDFKTDSQYQIALQKSQLCITDTVDAKKVFDKVISIIIKIISDKKPNYVTFQADEPNRQRLYKSIVKDVLSKINTYQQINHNPVTDQPTEDGEFWLKLNP
jgi:hypothetical protein